MLLRILALLCAAATFIAAADTGNNTPGKEDSVFTLMTYNIHHGEGIDGKLDIDRIADVIRSAAPDIVCLQEVDRNVPRSGNRDIAAELAAALDMAFVFGKNLDLDGGGYGNAILTRFPILDHENIPLPGPEGVEPRGCLSARLEIHGAATRIFCTHFGLKGAERLSQARALLKKIPGGEPVVLAGDLNETLDAAGLQLLSTALTAADILPGTQPYSVPSRKPARRIDHVYVAGGLETREARVLTTDETRVASDHLPVVAKIGKKEP